MNFHLCIFLTFNYFLYLPYVITSFLLLFLFDLLFELLNELLELHLVIFGYK
jgi:hypothetical protein